MDKPKSHQAYMRWNYQKNSVLDVLKLSNCSLYQDVTLICSDGSLKLNSFLLAAVFPLFKKILVKVAQYEEELVISLPDVVGEKIKQFLSDLLEEEVKVVLGESLKFLFLNQQDVEIHSMNDIERESKEEIDKEDQIFKVNSHEMEDTEVDFAELDPLDDEISKEKDIKLGANQDDIKDENDDDKLRSLDDLNDMVNKLFSKKDGGRFVKYGCLHCPYLSWNISNMKAHVETHIDGLKELLKCSVCHKSYSTQISLLKHKQKFHENKVIGQDIEENDEESGDDEDQSEEIINIKKLKVGNEFLCNYDDCPYRSKRPGEIRKHLKRHANGLSIPYPKGFKEDKQKCIIEDCEFKAPSLRSINLRRHLESQHSDVSPLCQQCGKTFSSFKNLLGHMNMHEIAVSCDMCGKFVSRANLKRHIRTNHMNEDSIECNKCKRTFRPLTFSKHKCLGQETPKKVCIICGKLVCNLTGHIKDVHSEIKTVQCPVCGKSVKEYCFKSHMISHEEKKACPICGINVKSVEKHLKTVHTEDDKKRFQCQDCGKGFMRVTDLQKHRINVHLKTYPYHCRYGCDAKYNDTSNRNSHEKKKHGGTFKATSKDSDEK